MSFWRVSKKRRAHVPWSFFCLPVLQQLLGVRFGLPEPNLVFQGSSKDTFCNHLKHGFFHTKIRGKPPFTSCNVQVYNLRIPVFPRWVVLVYWGSLRQAAEKTRAQPLPNEAG